MKKSIINIFALLSFLLFSSCSSETQIAGQFLLSAGENLTIQTDIKPKYSYGGIYFTLTGIPDSKVDRDYRDFIRLELIDEQNRLYYPEKIWDINGGKRDIVASFYNLPSRIRIKIIKVYAIRDLNGSKIRWWTGELK